MRVLICCVAILLLGGCHWKDEAEHYKHKFLEEARHHYQTQVIKSTEIEQMSKELAALRKENEELKAKLEGR